VVHAHAGDDFAQAMSTGGEEKAEHSAVSQFFEPSMPIFRARAQPIEDAGQLGRDHGLGVAKEPAGVIDQEQVAPESMIENPPTATAKISASSSSRFSIHSLRSNGVSLSRKARRTQRVTQP
jgi:hypothetical protein